MYLFSDCGEKESERAKKKIAFCDDGDGKCKPKRVFIQDARTMGTRCTNRLCAIECEYVFCGLLHSNQVALHRLSLHSFHFANSLTTKNENLLPRLGFRCHNCTTHIAQESTPKIHCSCNERMWTSCNFILIHRWLFYEYTKHINNSELYLYCLRAIPIHRRRDSLFHLRVHTLFTRRRITSTRKNASFDYFIFSSYFSLPHTHTHSPEGRALSLFVMCIVLLSWLFSWVYNVSCSASYKFQEDENRIE